MPVWPRKIVTSSSRHWHEALNVPVFSLLTEPEQQELIQQASFFLQKKSWQPLEGLQLTESDETRLALLFCLPVLKLGLHYLDGFHDVLLYPSPFIVDSQWQDEYGLVHSERHVESGQSWQQGPIVLNMQDIQECYDLSGYNLVIHEIAHKLDARSGGIMNGIPAIPLRAVADWEQQLQQIIENIKEEVALAGEDAATIDSYAATSPAECFAVLSEYFFTAPELLTERFPAFYQHLVDFYRQDPVQRLRQCDAIHAVKIATYPANC